MAKSNGKQQQQQQQQQPVTGNAQIRKRRSLKNEVENESNDESFDNLDSNLQDSDEGRTCSSFRCILIISLSLLIPSIFAGYVLYSINNMKKLEPIKYNEIITDAPSLKWFTIDNFFESNTLDTIKQLALNIDPFTTIVEDHSVESAGEAVPAGHVDCRHPFMTLNLNRTICHFSNRLDVGIHFVKTGGFNGYIEYYERMVARIISFRKRVIQQNKLEKVPSEFKYLKEFNTDSFKSKLKSICYDTLSKNRYEKNKLKDANSVVTEVFQLDLVIMLPGQELPMHLNVPYFWGADRNTLPQWLLVAMKASGLFDHIFVPQVQGLSAVELGESKENSKEEYVDLEGDGGDFYLYPYLPQLKNEKDNDNPNDKYSYENLSKYVMLKLNSNQVVLLDGAEVIHGVDRYKPNDLPPLYSANHHYNMRYDDKNGIWNLFDSKNELLRSYSKDDVKLMIAWNTHCFSNEEQRLKYNSKKDIPNLSLKEIMDVFKSDLKSKSRLPNDEIEPLELWTIVLKEYLRYPINTKNQNSTIFGFNYCLLPNILPEWFNKKFLEPILAEKC